MTTARFDDIGVCVFDAYGTLFDLGSLALDKADRALGERTGPFLDLWRRKQLEYTWLRSLMDRYDDFWHVTGESLDYTLAAFGIDDAVLRSQLMEAYLAPPLFPEVTRTLTRLRDGGIKTAVLSNGNPSMLVEAVKSTGIYTLFDDIISVDTLGIYKPHPSVYRLATERLNVSAGQIAFQTANGWDAAGAAAFGFQVAWVNRGRAPAERLPATPAAEIATLDELPALLGL